MLNEQNLPVGKRRKREILTGLITLTRIAVKNASIQDFSKGNELYALQARLGKRFCNVLILNGVSGLVDGGKFGAKRRNVKKAV